MKTVRVLIAEDEPIVRMDLKELLESQGYEVIGEASDGKIAIELARTRCDYNGYKNAKFGWH